MKLVFAAPASFLLPASTEHEAAYFEHQSLGPSRYTLGGFLVFFCLGAFAGGSRLAGLRLVTNFDVVDVGFGREDWRRNEGRSCDEDG